MDIERKRNFIISVMYIAVIAALVYLTLVYVLPALMPFAIGFVIALVLRPLVDTINVKLKINRKWVSLLVLILFYATIGTAIFFGSLRLFLALKDLFTALPDLYLNNIEPAVRLLFTKLQDLLSQLDPNLISGIEMVRENIISSLGSIFSTISSSSIALVTSLATSIPGVLISFLFTIVASFFFTIDFHEVIGFVAKQLPAETTQIIVQVNDDFFGTIMKFVKAYAILMSVTFVELSIGFTILKLENAILVAMLIALIDILPVLGTGGVVIPWVGLELVQGNLTFGLGLFIVYLVVTVVRNILEPKVVGDSIGLYPLVTLSCMLVGAKLFGVVGLFGLPIAATIIKSLNDKNMIQWFK